MAKVLLADSSVTIQKVVELVLKDKGFEVKTVKTGGEALAAITSFKPDIVLADSKLPDINGYELCTKIRSDATSKNIPFILLSGAFDPVEAERLSSVGANDSISKPFEAEDLLSKVNALVGAEAAEEVAEAVEEEEEAYAIAEEEEEGVSFADIDTTAEEEPSMDVEAVEEISEDDIEAAIAEPETVEAEEFVAPVQAAATGAVAPSMEGLSDMIKETVDNSLAKALAGIDGAVVAAVKEKLGGSIDMAEIKSDLLEVLHRDIRESAEKILLEVAPELTERLMKEALKECLGSLRQAIENVVWETVPELAETIIKSEIEKIKALG